jgi:hypothetical protein
VSWSSTLNSLNQELPGHKWYASEDSILEWKEPSEFRPGLTRAELKGAVRALPFAFPALAVFCMVLLLAKISNGQSLKEVQWSRFFIASLLLAVFLAVLLALIAFSRAALARWNPSLVRFASKGIGRWGSAKDGELHVEYADIASATLSAHPVFPQFAVILLSLRNGKRASLVLAQSIEPDQALGILRQHGVPVTQSSPDRAGGTDALK